jgi:hypothetical protein
MKEHCLHSSKNLAPIFQSPGLRNDDTRDENDSSNPTLDAFDQHCISILMNDNQNGIASGNEWIILVLVSTSILHIAGESGDHTISQSTSVVKLIGNQFNLFNDQNCNSPSIDRECISPAQSIFNIRGYVEEHREKVTESDEYRHSKCKFGVVELFIDMTMNSTLTRMIR